MTAHILQADARAIPLRDGAVDAVLTSPPYNANKDYPCDDWGDDWNGHFAFLAHCYAECRRVARGPVAWLFPFSLNIGPEKVLMCPWGQMGSPWKRVRLVLRHPSLDESKSLINMPPRAEVLVCDRWPENNGPKIWYIPHQKFAASVHRPGMSAGHPAGFHPRLVHEFLAMFTSVQSICDPFGGTGTTAVAAQRRGIMAVTMDLDLRWVRVQQRELAQRSLFG